ncbi:hypothetical protein Vadar_024999 [Vaccinium darrowii]|uniref:Uncharacterized protein n=1 Tax=Vaccinium darrowii TaxID=229202 RepID=A0ACB7Y346_9ERIC|nr:hypothetical protein Vadar_024999 [Vaccinium darrowii]
MWIPRNAERHGVVERLIAVAIDKDNGSQYALKWAVDNLVTKGQTLVLVHVNVKSGSHSSALHSNPRYCQIFDGYGSANGDLDPKTKDLFLPFRCFCTRKDIQCLDIVLEGTNVTEALVEFVSQSAIEILVLGAHPKGGFLRRMKSIDIPCNVTKAVPDFCNVYVISSKGKISSTRSASRPAPAVSPLRNQIQYQARIKTDRSETTLTPCMSTRGTPKVSSESQPHNIHNDPDFIKSPFSHRNGPNGRPYGELPSLETDISFVSSGRTSVDRMLPSFYDSHESSRSSRPSNSSEVEHHSFESPHLGRKSTGASTPPEFSIVSNDSGKSSPSHSHSHSHASDDVEAEMDRLKLQLAQMMEMYSTACKEAICEKEKAKELQRWKAEEQQKSEETRLAEESIMAIIKREKEKSKAAIEHAEAAQRIAEMEAQKRINAEMRALKEAEEKNKVLQKLSHSSARYRKYTIEEIEAATHFFSQSRKIGEGGYGPVYKCFLDHTQVAVKVLRPDAAQGRSQFQKEVEVLSCIRHPNMVLLLGACPEYGCLVYEYMSKGSLEDCLFGRGHDTPLSWQHRFRIATEIATGLLFLHQSKPEPIVHRDLKPGNILLDRNYVSKISDVGLARLVPPSVADTVTQYRMTSTAGTFCYIDPEYQQTGMLGVKSDVYSLGIIFLQILTGKPPMGLTHHVERAIEKGTFSQILDPAVPDWPVEEALCLAKLALECAELRRKDRPDLGKVVLPELERLAAIAEESMFDLTSDGRSGVWSPSQSHYSLCQEELSCPTNGYDSSRSRSSMDA